MTGLNHSFSLRQGYQKVQPIQINGISQNLSADIFNFLWEEFFEGVNSAVHDNTDYFGDPVADENFRTTWKKFFHEPASAFASGVFTDNFQSRYNSLAWYEKYDLLEFCVKTLNSSLSILELCKRANTDILEPNNSGYRFLKHILTPISSKVTLKTIGNAIQANTGAGHIEKAVKELAKRQNRNPNQIAAEAINGAESTTKVFVQKLAPEKQPSNKSLGQLLKIIKDNNLLTSDPAYSESMSKLYGYLSNIGVRHGKLPGEQSEISLSEATYILEICSAFVNYLSAEMSD